MLEGGLACLADLEQQSVRKKNKVQGRVEVSSILRERQRRRGQKGGGSREIKLGVKKCRLTVGKVEKKEKKGEEGKEEERIYKSVNDSSIQFKSMHIHNIKRKHI